MTLPTREMIAIHPQQADQPRRDAPAVGQRCKRNAAAHETPAECVADTLLYGLTQYRQRQWANKPRNQAVPREPGQALTEPHHVVHLSLVRRKEAIQNLMANRYPA